MNEKFMVIEKYVDEGSKEIIELNQKLNDLQNQLKDHQEASSFQSVASITETSTLSPSPTNINTPLRRSSKTLTSNISTPSYHAIIEEKDFTIYQLKATLEIMSHMSKQAADLTQQQRLTYQENIDKLGAQLQKYEMEIAKKYAIIN